MAGRFESVTGVTDEAGLLDVVGAVVESRDEVGGEIAGATYRLNRSGAVVDQEGAGAEDLLDERLRRKLVGLAQRVEDVFGQPQDVEWIQDEDGTLWLLQSRPVTGIRDVPARPDAELDASKPILGPGPVAETSPSRWGPWACWTVPGRCSSRSTPTRS